MANRLPTPGSDSGQWGQILNDFLAVEHNDDGTLKKAADIAAAYVKPGSGIPTADIANGAITNAKLALSGGSDNYVLTKDAAQSGGIKWAANSAANAVQKGDYFISVKDYNAVGNGTTDDRTAIQAAANAIPSSGGTLYFPPGTYRVTGPIVIKPKTCVMGAGKHASTMTATTAMGEIFRAASNTDFCHIGFLGGTVDDVTVPRRSRTRSPSFTNAVWAEGDLYPGSSAPAIYNVRIWDVRIANANGLPVFLRGIRGEASLKDSEISNNYDIGFVYCDSAIVTGNYVEKSCDNGISLSRGNRRVVCANNTVDLCCYYGIWVSGYVDSGQSINAIGPKLFTVTGNMITHMGKGGILLDDGPENGVVANNKIDNILNGASDETQSNAQGAGIMVGGNPSDNRASVSAYAQNIAISNNVISNVTRNGVALVGGCRYINITGNIIVDPGSQYYADGTTPIPTSDLAVNNGICVTQYDATCSYITARHNMLVDTRQTPLSNRVVYLSSIATAEFADNRAINSRVAAADSIETTTGVKIFGGSIRASGGVVFGSNAGTGIIAGPDINGAAGSRRQMRTQTAGVDRWWFGTNGDTESGANAGSNYELRARADDGTDIGRVFGVTRSSRLIAFDQPIKVPALVTGSRPTASSVGAGANMFDTTLNKPIWSDGTNWRDAAGTIV